MSRQTAEHQLKLYCVVMKHVHAMYYMHNIMLSPPTYWNVLRCSTSYVLRSLTYAVVVLKLQLPQLP
jgi:hypothetical protein